MTNNKNECVGWINCVIRTWLLNRCIILYNLFKLIPGPEYVEHIVEGCSVCLYYVYLEKKDILFYLAWPSCPRWDDKWINKKYIKK